MKNPEKVLKMAALGIVGSFVFYILSLGPMYITQHYNPLPQLAPWFEFYMLPAQHLARFRPLGDFIGVYLHIWERATGAPGGSG